MPHQGMGGSCISASLVSTSEHFFLLPHACCGISFKRPCPLPWPLPQQVPLVAHIYHSRSHWLHLSTPAGPTGYIPTPAGPIGYTHLTQQVPLVTHTYPSRSYWLHTCPSRSRWLHKSTPAGPNGCTCLLQQVSHWLQVPLVANI